MNKRIILKGVFTITEAITKLNEVIHDKGNMSGIYEIHSNEYRQRGK